MVKVDVSTEASIALEESAFWYENQAPGLGIDFCVVSGVSTNAI